MSFRVEKQKGGEPQTVLVQKSFNTNANITFLHLCQPKNCSSPATPKNKVNKRSKTNPKEKKPMKKQ